MSDPARANSARTCRTSVDPEVRAEAVRRLARPISWQAAGSGVHWHTNARRPALIISGTCQHLAARPGPAPESAPVRSTGSYYSRQRWPVNYKANGSNPALPALRCAASLWFCAESDQVVVEALQYDPSQNRAVRRRKQHSIFTNFVGYRISHTRPRRMAFI